MAGKTPLRAVQIVGGKRDMVDRGAACRYLRQGRRRSGRDDFAAVHFGQMNQRRLAGVKPHARGAKRGTLADIKTKHVTVELFQRIELFRARAQIEMVYPRDCHASRAATPRRGPLASRAAPEEGSRMPQPAAESMAQPKASPHRRETRPPVAIAARDSPPATQPAQSPLPQTRAQKPPRESTAESSRARPQAPSVCRSPWFAGPPNAPPPHTAPPSRAAAPKSQKSARRPRAYRAPRAPDPSDPGRSRRLPEASNNFPASLRGRNARSPHGPLPPPDSAVGLCARTRHWSPKDFGEKQDTLAARTCRAAAGPA